MGLRGKKLGQTHCKVLQQSFLNIHISSTTGNYPSISYHYLSLQNTILQDQALGCGLISQKLGYIHFKLYDKLLFHIHIPAATTGKNPPIKGKGVP